MADDLGYTFGDMGTTYPDFISSTDFEGMDTYNLSDSTVTTDTPAAPTPAETALPGGAAYVDSKANNEFPISFDQSKISASITDILKSGVSGVGEALNTPGAAGQSFWSNITQAGWRNFTSTKTGAQVQKSLIGGQLQSMFSNPTILVGLAIVAAIIIATVAMRKKA